MLHSSEFRRKSNSEWIALVHTFSPFSCYSAPVAERQMVATYSFEDGTADGWTSFNGASTPVATTAAAYAGSLAC